MTTPAPEILGRSRLRKGGLSFAALTGAGLFGLFAFAAPEGTPPALEDLRPAFLFVALASALLDVVRGGRYSVALRERLGAVPHELDAHRGAIWLHAVSVGEVHAARGLP